jgi:hypothetical protein
VNRGPGIGPPAIGDGWRKGQQQTHPRQTASMFASFSASSAMKLDPENLAQWAGSFLPEIT